MNIFIGHVNKHKASHYIYVGRPTAMGNPFTIGKDGNRDEVCNKYKKWFDGQTPTNNPDFHKQLNIIREMYKYDDLTLLCWCHPKRCHAHTIRDWIISTKTGKKS